MTIEEGSWTVEQVRTEFERTFAGLDPTLGVELLGTLVTDERHLELVVGSRQLPRPH